MCRRRSFFGYWFISTWQLLSFDKHVGSSLWFLIVLLLCNRIFVFQYVFCHFLSSFCFSMLIFYVFYVRRWQQALSTWNAFCFSVKLFIMMLLWDSSFFRFRLPNTTQKMKFSYSSHQFVLLEFISTIF